MPEIEIPAVDGAIIDEFGRTFVVVDGMPLQLVLSPDEMRAWAVRLIETADRLDAHALRVADDAIQKARVH
ncbi:hypothetical protein SAMN06297251_103121 [Fulvimarina manganoxydans]|uniref:Uncharacterized protein n=1 Tax=Fulvimarina manganoxydans TaxID=937218 RepID=A0A1W1ZTL5_9HYPH|nr:hypothetical protein [Fulvimarina manganoxydans]SMC51703.1 hypothetical protein SAMN06297251_103121 [Fulvimarina manganoxydans]